MSVAMEVISSSASLVQDLFHVRVVLPPRSEEHTSELQSRLHLVCRLLLETKNHTAVLSIEGALAESVVVKHHHAQRLSRNRPCMHAHSAHHVTSIYDCDPLAALRPRAPTL